MEETGWEEAWEGLFYRKDSSTVRSAKSGTGLSTTGSGDRSGTYSARAGRGPDVQW